MPISQRGASMGSTHPKIIITINKVGTMRTKTKRRPAGPQRRTLVRPWTRLLKRAPIHSLRQTGQRYAAIIVTKVVTIFLSVFACRQGLARPIVLPKLLTKCGALLLNTVLSVVIHFIGHFPAI